VCGAGAWLNGLASEDQRRLTGSDSASEACSRGYATQIHHYFILLYFWFHFTFKSLKNQLAAWQQHSTNRN